MILDEAVARGAEKLRVCEAVEDMDDPHGTRVWEVCALLIERRLSGRHHWRDLGTISSHRTWREAMNSAMELSQRMKQEARA